MGTQMSFACNFDTYVSMIAQLLCIGQKDSISLCRALYARREIAVGRCGRLGSREFASGFGETFLDEILWMMSRYGIMMK